jgi:hypothetical protein
MTNTSAKILVYTTLYNTGVDFFNLPYAKYTTAINEDYCSKHNYEWRVLDLDPAFPEERPRPWLRVWYALANLADYDYIMFLDGDAFFVSPSSIEEKLLPYFNGEVSFLFAPDQKLPNHVFHQTLPNAGVFLIKNCPEALGIVNAWWDVPSDVSHADSLFYDSGRYLDQEDTLTQHPFEQLALWFVFEKFRNAFQLTNDYRELNGVDGNFVRHLIQVPDAIRERAAKDFFDNNIKTSTYV